MYIITKTTFSTVLPFVAVTPVLLCRIYHIPFSLNWDIHVQDFLLYILLEWCLYFMTGEHASIALCLVTSCCQYMTLYIK